MMATDEFGPPRDDERFVSGSAAGNRMLAPNGCLVRYSEEQLDLGPDVVGHIFQTCLILGIEN